MQQLSRQEKANQSVSSLQSPANRTLLENLNFFVTVIEDICALHLSTNIAHHHIARHSYDDNRKTDYCNLRMLALTG